MKPPLTQYPGLTEATSGLLAIPAVRKPPELPLSAIPSSWHAQPSCRCEMRTPLTQYPGFTEATSGLLATRAVRRPPELPASAIPSSWRAQPSCRCEMKPPLTQYPGFTEATPGLLATRSVRRAPGLPTLPSLRRAAILSLRDEAAANAVPRFHRSNLGPSCDTRRPKTPWLPSLLQRSSSAANSRDPVFADPSRITPGHRWPTTSTSPAHCPRHLPLFRARQETYLVAR
jgi:hypothetical protein